VSGDKLELYEQIALELAQQLDREKDGFAQQRASEALSKIGGKRVVKRLHELLQDKDADVRRCAAKVLENIPENES